MNRSLFETAPPSAAGHSVASHGIACVDVPAFPLQLVLREHPDWREDPVVVVAEDRPLAEILWANRPARERRIRRGMKFAQAQSLVARLHGQTVPPERVAAAREELLRLFVRYTPNVEPEEDAPGLFWLDPTGLATLYGGLETWTRRVHGEVAALGFVASVVAGWQRGSSLAIARTQRGAAVLPDPDTERRLATPVPLAHLALSPALLEAMAVLDVRTFGEFLALPAAGLRLRYGEEAARLHDVASGQAWTPLRPHRFHEPVRAEIPIDPPDDDHARLLFGIKGALHRLLDELAERSEGVAALHLTLDLDHGPPHEERIEAASPTLVAARLVDLVRLRLDVLRLPAPVERIVLVLE
ncbi:DNA polymerase Y family protein, partial [bacterium]|nr:DNA polymerase Y family protein [bacterium]